MHLNNLETLPDIFVFSRKQNKGAIEALFNMYKLEKSGFKISYIDAELRPDLLKKFHISKVPTILFKNGFREKRVFSSRDFFLLLPINKLVNLAFLLQFLKFLLFKTI